MKTYHIYPHGTKQIFAVDATSVASTPADIIFQTPNGPQAHPWNKVKGFKRTDVEIISVPDYGPDVCLLLDLNTPEQKITKTRLNGRDALKMGSEIVAMVA